MTFEAARVSHVSNPGPIVRVVIGRLVMPAVAAEIMAKAILDFLEQRRGQPAPAQSTPTLQ